MSDLRTVTDIIKWTDIIKKVAHNILQSDAFGIKKQMQVSAFYT